ncbi:hypothetical protein KAJ27_15710 [bacterium]|nr:hypothetical protein [bacterium]
MKFKFWGVRGSIPVPEQEMLKYGGNTSCLQVIPDGCDDIIVFDAGTGIRRLGFSLMQREKINCHIMISHIHWDHIQGIPFFGPLYSKENKIKFYGALKVDARLKEALSGQMDSLYFPIKLDELTANMEFMELIEETFIIGNLKIMTRNQNHPGGSLGFRIQQGNQVIAYCTDNELPDEEPVQNVVDLIKDADVLIMDAMYDEDEYIKYRVGWGHAFFTRVARYAAKQNVGKLYLTHHGPSVTDDVLEERLEIARRIFPETYLAREGLLVDLGQTIKKVESDVEKSEIGCTDEVKFNFIDNKVFIEFPEEFILSESSFNFKHIFKGKHVNAIMFNFANLKRIDSRGIGQVAAIINFASKFEILVAAYSLTEYVHYLLKLTHIDSLLTIFENETQALDFIEKR